MPGPDPEREPSALDPEFLEALIRSGRANAILSWPMVGILVLVLGESVLDGDLQWTVFVAAAGTVVLLAPVAARDWQTMLPWELLGLALLPILVRGLLGGEVGIFASYVSLSALALLIVVELHRFTTLRVTHWFAVVLVTMTTMASVAAWSIVRWGFDRYAETAYLTTNEALMQEFLWVTLAGVVAGILFDVYVRRREQIIWRALRRVIHR